MYKHVIKDKTWKKMEESATFFPKKLPPAALGIYEDEKIQEEYDNVAECARVPLEKDELDYNIITNMIQMKTTVGGTKIITDYFYLMDVKYFDAKKNNEQYIMAEITVLRFNLMDGIDDVYQEFLTNDGPISNASASNKKLVYHKFGKEMPDNVQEPKNYAKVLANIVGFLRKGKSKSELTPPIYTYSIKIVAEFLKLLCYNCGENFSAFTVFKLEVMFVRMLMGLYERRGEELKIRNPRRNLNRILPNGQFVKTKGLTCKLHKRRGDEKIECTQRSVKRWAYTIFGDCCPLVENLTMLPEKHIPLGFYAPDSASDPTTATVYYKHGDGFAVHTYRLPKKNYALMYLQIVTVMSEFNALEVSDKTTGE